MAKSPLPNPASRLALIDAFANLSREDQGLIASRLEPQLVARGEMLVRQGDEADALYIVVSGRFQVLLRGSTRAVAEIGPGSPVGEIAFFAGGTRTANVRAERDSLVLRLTRDDFDELAESSPSIWPAITATLALRLAATTAGGRQHTPTHPRTIAICRGGAGPLDHSFVGRLRAVFERRANTIVLDGNGWQRAPGGVVPLTSKQDTAWFNELEAQYDFVFYVADDELTAWSQKSIRQADMVLLVARAADGASEPNPIERLAASLLAPENIRLALLHDRSGSATGTRDWLASRPFVGSHHHVGTHTTTDYERLFRFIDGSAVGLVACGGGAFCSAHIGLFQAMNEAGCRFDIVGGTSGGAAMAAAYALGADADEIERRTHDMFVTRRAMRRWTVPFYSLLDPGAFDAALVANFSTTDIEDMWIPFYAVSTNLTRGTLTTLRRGALWEALRASAAIPALLPPVFTPAGEMLVDGCLLDNVPLDAMRAAKSGPNVVIEFRVPQLDHFEISHRDLPDRQKLFWASLTRSGRQALPNAPSPQSVLMRSLMLYRRELAREITADDVLLAPPIPEGMGHLDWHRHAELRQSAYAYARDELERLRGAGHPLLRG